MLFQGRAGEEGNPTVSEFRSGADEAFSRLYERFQKPIAKYVRSMIRDVEVTEELVQEIFLKVFRFREHYNEGFAFSTWLWTIARNTVRDYQRGKKLYFDQDQGDEFPILPEEIPCEKHNAETLVVNKDQRRSLFRALRPLTRQQRRVIWMRMVRQLSYPEIAKKLGLSLASVKNLAHRAKGTLAGQATLM